MRDFDELLDGVLREDASAEPRTGLEGRVMARVRGEEGLSRGSFSRYWNRRRRWLFIPAAACLGIAALVWYGVDGGVPQPQRIDSRVSSSTLSASSVGEMEDDGRSRLGGSGRTSRDSHPTAPPTSRWGPHLRDDKAVAKMGHPGVSASALPENVAVERVSIRQKSALVAHAARSLPTLRIASIEIAPLAIKPIGGLSEGFTRQERKVKTNEDVSWSVVLVCDGDGGVGGSAGTDGKAGVECGRSVVRYTVLSADAGAEIYGERGWATGSRAAEHHD